jgi:hypothetical protein
VTTELLRVPLRRNRLSRDATDYERATRKRSLAGVAPLARHDGTLASSATLEALVAGCAPILNVRCANALSLRWLNSLVATELFVAEFARIPTVNPRTNAFIPALPGYRGIRSDSERGLRKRSLAAEARLARDDGTLASSATPESLVTGCHRLRTCNAVLDFSRGWLHSPVTVGTLASSATTESLVAGCAPILNVDATR